MLKHLVKSDDKVALIMALQLAARTYRDYAGSVALSSISDGFTAQANNAERLARLLDGASSVHIVEG